MIFKSDAKSKTRHCLLSISFASLSIFLLPEIAFSQCNQIYDWADWTSYTSNSASGKINTNGQVVDVVMSANYDFGNSTNIFGFDQFSGFTGTIPNSDVPETTWAIGAGGITTMCFSQTVSNPVLLLASIGRPGTPVTLKFSRSYSPIYTGTNVQYVNDSTIIGEEGYTILMFPGDFDCVTIYSNTPEYYTNITWGLNPPLFPISITGALEACNSTTLVASGGSSYVWSGGNNPSFGKQYNYRKRTVFPYGYRWKWLYSGHV